MSEVSPITPDSPLCQTLSCLPKKFIVDFVNGIDVVRDHLSTQCGRSGFFSRMYDGFTGQGVRRQIEINTSLVDGVEASLRWLVELSDSLAHSNLAITQVNDRMSALTLNVAKLAQYSADTRERLEDVAHQISMRMQRMNTEIARIDFIQQAQLDLDTAFSKWAAGRFAALSPAARCYVTLEELRWGALGDYFRNYADQRQSLDFFNLITDRATAQLARDAEMDPCIAADMASIWLLAPTGRHVHDDEMRQAQVYLAEGMTLVDAPFVLSVTNQRPAHYAVPLIASARRVAEGIVREVFPHEVPDA